MPHLYELTLTVKETNEDISLSGTLDEEELNLLNEFLQYVDDLLETKYVKDGMPANLKMDWKKNSGMVVATQLPNWEDVMTFLHRFRPIILNNENANFYKISNILGRKLDHPYFRSMFKEQRDLYGGKKMQSAIRIQSNDVLLNSEELLQDWLNSFEYHRDKEKREFIESLHVMFPLDASKVLFLGLLSHKVQATFNIAAITRVVVGKQSSLEGKVKLPDLNNSQSTQSV